jgi:hypothetical protein
MDSRLAMDQQGDDRKKSLRPSLTSVGLTSDLSNTCIEERAPDQRIFDTCSPPRQRGLERESSLYSTLKATLKECDLSNICIDGRAPDQRIVANSSPPQQGDLVRESSLYPTMDELYDSSQQDLSVEEVFAQSESYRRMTRKKESMMLQKEAQFHPSHHRPGAYHGSSLPQGRVDRPELSAWVETSHNIREKVQRQGFHSEVQHEASRRDMVTHPQAIGRINDPRSFGPTNDALCSEERESSVNYRRPRPSAQPVEVEVAPGEYMPLRGSEETLQAIEMGHARIVTCFVCNHSLACVPDCELVICPDCRVISPVPSAQDGRKTEDTYYYEGRPARRGVGLGLKMRC